MEHGRLDSLSESTSRGRAFRAWFEANTPSPNTSPHSAARSAFDAGAEYGRTTTDPELVSRRICENCMLKVAGIHQACEEILQCAESKKRFEP